MPSTVDTEYFGTGNKVKYQKVRVWNTQAKPYIRALPYSLRVENSYAPKYGITNLNGHTTLSNSWVRGAARNAAISNLQSKLQVAQLGNNIGEYKSSANMITNRAKQLTQAYRDIRRGRLADAASTLNIRKPKRTRARTAAGVWLEYHYGWKPLISDVYAASNVFRNPQQPKVMRFSGRATRKTNVNGGRKTVTHTKHDWRPYRLNPSKLQWEPVENCRFHIDLEHRIECKAEAVCHLRDVSALQRLQLDNPAMVAWEILPFSFIADWFFPIGTYITSLSPAFRRQLQSASVTLKAQNDIVGKKTLVSDTGTDGPVYHQLVKDYPDKMGDTFSLDRSLGLAISNTWDRSFLQGDSFLRAGHAIALLVAIFSVDDGDTIPNTIWNRPLF